MPHETSPATHDVELENLMPTRSSKPSPSAPAVEPAPAITTPSAPTRVGSRHAAIARVAHEVNRVVTEFANDVPVQKPWDECSDEMKKSAIDGVEFFEKSPDASPEQAHENWLKFKVEQGWSYNGIYDEANKRHPNVRPFGALPPEVRLKDKVFRAVVGTMLKL